MGCGSGCFNQCLRSIFPNDRLDGISEKGYFYLIRPFYGDDFWQNDPIRLKNWKVDPNEINYTDQPDDADLMLIPYLVQDYFDKGLSKLLDSYNETCKSLNIKAYAMIKGDFGERFKEYSNIYYLRMGGFRSQLSDHNLGMYFALSDQLRKIYERSEISIREKGEKPVLGFCGHADQSFIKRVKENLKFLRINISRFIKQPLRKDYEVMFPSAYHRAQILTQLNSSIKLNCNFILRKNYRAGAKTKEQKVQSTKEYYDNLTGSDYILCLRGGGNFTVRMYETLMMGRIPVFVNTDCILPLENHIDWKKHMVWVEWKDRHHIADKVAEFHNNLSPEMFQALQKANRKLWENELGIEGFIKKLAA